jgi:hypothetical protein
MTSKKFALPMSALESASGEIPSVLFANAVSVAKDKIEAIERVLFFPRENLSRSVSRRFKRALRELVKEYPDPDIEVIDEAVEYTDVRYELYDFLTFLDGYQACLKEVFADC